MRSRKRVPTLTTPFWGVLSRCYAPCLPAQGLGQRQLELAEPNYQVVPRERGAAWIPLADWNVTLWKMGCPAGEAGME